MKHFIACAAACVALALCLSCGNTNKCLEKAGYSDCDHLRKALNLQNKDEAIKYHDLCVRCGCKEQQ